MTSKEITDIEDTIPVMEKHLTKEEFQDYCDHAQSCIAYMEKVIKKLEE